MSLRTSYTTQAPKEPLGPDSFQAVDSSVRPILKKPSSTAAIKAQMNCREKHNFPPKNFAKLQQTLGGKASLPKLSANWQTLHAAFHIARGGSLHPSSALEAAQTWLPAHPKVLKDEFGTFGEIWSD